MRHILGDANVHVINTERHGSVAKMACRSTTSVKWVANLGML